MVNRRVNRNALVCALLLLCCAVPALAQPVVYDQGPTTGTISNNGVNQLSTQSLADRATFPATTEVAAIVIFNSEGPRSGTVRARIFADSGGVPGAVLYAEDKVPDTWEPQSDIGDYKVYKIRVILTTPFVAQAGVTYWYGVTGNADMVPYIRQYFLQSPDNSQIALFSAGNFIGMNNSGDQMFQLEGPAPVPAISPWGLSLLGLLLAGMGVAAVRRRRGADRVLP